MITKSSNSELFKTLVDNCEFDTDHILKHSSGMVSPRSEYDGVEYVYSEELVWDYTWGIESHSWDSGHWLVYNQRCEQVAEFVAQSDMLLGLINPDLSTNTDVYDALLLLQDEISKTLKQTDKIITGLIESGSKVEGFGLVKGRKTRKITNNELLVESLTDVGLSWDQLYDTKLIGIPAIEKLLSTCIDDKSEREFLLSGLIDEVEGKPSLKRVD